MFSKKKEEVKEVKPEAAPAEPAGKEKQGREDIKDKKKETTEELNVKI